MSILWCGGEDIDFPVFTGCSISSTSLYFNSGYARCAISLSKSSAAKSTAFPGGAVTSGWLSFKILRNTNTYRGSLFLGFGNLSTTRSGLYVGSDVSTGNKLALWKYDGTTKTELASESGTSLTSAINKIDIHLQDYGASATVEVYINKTLIISYSGDITVSGLTNVDAVFIGALSGTFDHAYVSEIIVADSDTRNMSLVTNYLSAAGDSNSWTGAYTDIDEVTIDDSDLIYDNTNGHQALFGLSDLPSGNFSVLAIKEAVRSCKSSDSTPTSINLGIKSGGTVNVSDNHALSISWTTYERYMSTNPMTGNPFSTSEINALQLAIEATD